MLYLVPHKTNWQKYIERRFLEAQEIGLVASSSTIDWKNARFFFEEIKDKELEKLELCDPEYDKTEEVLACLLNTKYSPPKGWVQKRDFYEMAVDWLINKFSLVGDDYLLVSEGGFSKAGDKALNSLPHFSYKDRIFFFNEVASTTDKTKFLQILKKGRSLRFLGVIDNLDRQLEEFLPVKAGWFLCDVFDNDSLIILEIKKGD